MKKKIIFLQGSLSPYRISFFNGLSQIYDTTIISHTDIQQKDFLFTHKVVKKIKIMFLFFSLLNFINKINPDTIIIQIILNIFLFYYQEYSYKRKKFFGLVCSRC